jgi:DNA polymerase III subunit chi
VIVDFYHLSQSALERVLPTICEKVLASGERLLVVAGAEQLDSLDALLWSYAPDAFLPHARASAARAEAQPILLSGELVALNGATNVALADGVWRDEALGFSRTFYFFDPNGLDPARAAWRALKDRLVFERRYWKQMDGRWVAGP